MSRLEKLARSLSGIVFQCLRQPDGSISFPYISSNCESLLGKCGSALQDRADCLLAKIHPDDRLLFYGSLESSARSLQPWQWEGRFLLPALREVEDRQAGEPQVYRGNLRWMRLTGQPEQLSEGTVLWDGVLMFLDDRPKGVVHQDEGDRLQYLLASSPSVVYSFKPYGDFARTFVSENIKRYGYSVAEFMQDPNLWFRSVHPEDKPHLIALDDLLTKGRGVHEYRFRCGNGKYRWIHDELQVIYNERGEAEEVVGSWLDISDRKQMEEMLKHLNEGLEAKVTERTQSIQQALEYLQNEVQYRRRMEEALRESEERFRATFEHVAIGMGEMDMDGRCTRVNPGFCQILGYSEAELLGLSLSDISHPEDLRRDAEQVQRSIDGEIPAFSMQKRFLRKDGSIVWTNLTVSLVRDADGAPKYTVGVLEDVTDRVLAQAELQRKNEEMQAIFQAFPDLFFRMAADGTILEYAMGNESELYLPPENFLGTRMMDVLSPVNLSKQRGKSAGDRFDWALQEVQRTHALVSVEYSLPATDGDRHFEARLVPFGDGEAIAIIRDITEQVQAKQALKESQERLDSILNAMSDTVWSVAADSFKFIYVNQAVEQIYNCTMAEFLSDPYLWLEMVHPEDREWVKRASTEDLMVRGTKDIEYRILWRTGEVRWIRDRAQLICDEAGKPLRVDGIATDTTERKRAEMALQEASLRERQKAEELQTLLVNLQRTQARLVQSEKMSSLGQLVAGVAHEINNPVNFISGNLVHLEDYTRQLAEVVALYHNAYPAPPREIAEAIASKELPYILEDLPNLLRSMQMGANRICEIVLSLRNFSRLDEADRKRANLHDGIESTLLILQNRLKAKPNQPEIKVVKTYGDLPQVECYPGQLNQVFMNILANAIDALDDLCAERQSPTIWIETWMETRLDEGDRAVVIIRDNGSGIPPEVQSRLFDPFFTTKPVGKGTGLGLSISYQIVVERHGGELLCTSIPGRGTEFIIAIPLGSHTSDR